jgi:prepilin-type processing-associated H-X9-DG protein
MSHRHNDGANISFFDGHSKWAKRQWLEQNPQIFHQDSTRLP